MAGLESRVNALESRASVLADGRDPGLIEIYEIMARSEGIAFDIELVPRWVMLRELLDVIDGSSRGLPHHRDPVADAAVDAKWTALINARA